MSELRIARLAERCRTLGPGVRAVIWVQGCLLRCPGCVAPETHALDGGTAVPVATLVQRLAALPDIDGLTISGGEPLLQAEALNELIDGLRRHRDLSVMVYTGYTFEHLQQHGTAAQRALLARCDILVDGPFLRSAPTTRRWRGSENQRVLLLSERHRDLAASLDEPLCEIDVRVDADGTLMWMGIPTPELRERVEAGLSKRGVRWKVTG
ncbi:MAG: 4Fe-4S single cluster domain-containing protein [Planctomycetota bacterium]|nr:radical SAM protein [Planctomycetota bacterium]MCX8003954.1 radical SAM protein [Burkholderiaceae bacterium]MDW8373882.1 4Fe-4S single cluster domain-containing protein [Planctomycetota bacterium]